MTCMMGGQVGGRGGAEPEKQVGPPDPTTDLGPNPRPFALPAKSNGFQVLSLKN